MKILINNEEVLSGKDFTISEEMLNTSSVILNNVFPASWENDKDYVSNFYYPPDYSKCLIYDKYEQDEGTTVRGNDLTINYDDSKLWSYRIYGSMTGLQHITLNNTVYDINLGKNLFDISKMTVGYWVNGQGSYNQNSYWNIGEAVEVEPNTPYTLSRQETTGAIQLGWAEYDENNNFIKQYSQWASNVNSMTWTTTATTKYVRPQYNNSYNMTDIQFEKGNERTTYSQYFTPIVLGANDYIFKDVNWYTNISGTSTLIDVQELTQQLNAIELQNGNNTISISSGELEIHYNYTDLTTNLIFCGVVKNTGDISLNPRHPHFCDLQILDFKMFLSQVVLDFVIANKTIQEAIQQVTNAVASYGFVVGNIELANPNEIIGAYSTKDKSPYDVFNYIADITQSRWTTRMLDQDTVAIDFYDPALMPRGTTINYTQQFFEDNLIDDMSFSYGTYDYRNKQVMTSNEVMANITSSESIIANGYQTQYNTEQKIGKVNTISVDGVAQTIATNNEKEMGITADFYYTPNNQYIESDNPLTASSTISIEYTAIVQGRQIVIDQNEINRVANATGRNGTLARYENRNDATTSNELQLIGQSYIKYKGQPEIKLTISTRENIWNVGERVQFNAPIDELDTEYMVRTKSINYIATVDTIFYTYELTSSFNAETEINYFDNQRAKNKGNIGEGEFISRNIDIENVANIIFYDTEIEEVQ